MAFPLSIELAEHGRVFHTCVAHHLDDLRIPIEMLTGIAWLDTEPLYAQMLQQEQSSIRLTMRACLSYEKWDAWQQETRDIRVTMRGLSAA